MSTDHLKNFPAQETEGPWSREHQRQLIDVMNTHGFYFHTLDEQKKIQAFTPDSHRPRPVLGFFNMIAQKNEDRKEATSMALRTLSDYAGKSLDNIEATQALEVELYAEHVDPTATFSDVFPRTDWRFDRSRIANFTAVSRYVEAGNFAVTGERDSVTVAGRIDETQGEERLARISWDLGDFTVEELRSVCAVFIEAEQARTDYWQARVYEAGAYWPLRQQSDEALTVLRARNVK